MEIKTEAQLDKDNSGKMNYSIFTETGTEKVTRAVFGVTSKLNDENIKLTEDNRNLRKILLNIIATAKKPDEHDQFIQEAISIMNNLNR